jgi:hypothetical protein
MWAGSVPEPFWSCHWLHNCIIHKHDVSFGKILKLIRIWCLIGTLWGLMGFLGYDQTGQSKGLTASIAVTTKIHVI